MEKENIANLANPSLRRSDAILAVKKILNRKVRKGSDRRSGREGRKGLKITEKET